MSTLLSRIYRTHGHGVHSPFAYKLITDVIHSRYGYYGYAEIDDLAHHMKMSPRQLRLARLLLRLTAAFNPSVVAFTTEPSELYRRAVELANSDIEVTVGTNATFVVVPEGTPDIPRVGERQVVVYLDADIRTDIGMSFSNGHASIVVRDDMLPNDHFNIRF